MDQDQAVNIKRYSELTSGAEIPSRANRFYKLSDNWYFTTREGLSMGPYDSQEEAKTGTSDYITFVSNAAPHVLKLLTPNSQNAPT